MEFHEQTVKYTECKIDRNLRFSQISSSSVPKDNLTSEILKKMQIIRYILNTVYPWITPLLKMMIGSNEHLAMWLAI